MKRIAALLFVLLSLSCVSASAPAVPDAAAVNAVIDRFHAKAAVADEPAYFALYSPTGVFLGTDATERWTKEEFQKFAHPYFAAGKGWTFKPHDRHVQFSAHGDVAWFDELLDSASYGLCRGTGVVAWQHGAWQIEQYNLSIPIPNDLAKEFVAKIRAK